MRLIYRRAQTLGYLIALACGVGAACSKDAATPARRAGSIRPDDMPGAGSSRGGSGGAARSGTTGGSNPATGGTAGSEADSRAGESGAGGSPTAGGSAPTAGTQSSAGGRQQATGGTTGATGAGGTTAGGTSSTGGAAGALGGGGNGATSGTGGTATGGGGNGAASGTGGTAAGGTGCGKAGAQTGDFHLKTTDGTGTTRDYEVIVPAAYDPAVPLALTFVYHGANADQNASKAFGLQNASGAGAASIFVFPQGISYKTFGIGWDDNCGGYDVVFFDHMLASLKAAYCVDEQRVFAAGFSWGGDHVTTLACCRGSSLRAVAASSCTDEFSNAANYQTYQNLPCPSSGASGIRFTYDSNGDSAYTAQMFSSTVALYRSFNGCGTSSVAAGSSCVSYEGCTQPFTECRYPGLGHALPSTWAADTWNFLAAY